MVFTDVTINGLTHTMWLPVMDGANKAMKSEGYTHDTKFKKDISVEPATMFDINKTIMRCLVKNLAMFGLGLYIYSGEDLPEIELEKITAKDASILKSVVKSFEEPDKLYAALLNRYNVKSFKELTVKQRAEILEGLKEISRRNEVKNGNKVHSSGKSEGQTATSYEPD